MTAPTLRRRDPYIGRPVTRLTLGPLTDMVPVAPVLEHISTLKAIGMRTNMIARAAGVSDETLRLMMAGSLSTTRRHYADAILSVDGRPTKHQALVLGIGTRRRLQGLAVTGWSLDVLGERLSANRSRMSKMRGSQIVTWGLHERVRAVFESLGPDGGSASARRHAVSRGWVHPLLWDDIDDPFETPREVVDSGLPDEIVVQRLVDGRHDVIATKAERTEAVHILTARGMSIVEISERIAVSQRQVERARALAVAV